MAIAPQTEPALCPNDDQSPQYDLKYIWAISLAVALGGLLFGYDWVVIGGAKVFYEKYFQITAAAMGQMQAARMSGWINSCTLLGCLIGSIICGALSDRYGRKRLLVASGIIFVASSLLTGESTSCAAFEFWRIVAGVGIGMTSILSPLYIAEVAPAVLRGRLVTINQLANVIGIFAAQAINWLIARHAPNGITDEGLRLSWYGQMGWRWMFYVVAVPSGIFLLLMLFVPESPRWLAKVGRADRARRILTRIGGAAHAARELAQIQATLSVTENWRVHYRHLFQPRVARILLIGMALAVLQSWCGIDVIFNYADNIFKQAGYGVSGTMSNIVITGVVMCVFTLLAILLVDRVGRRLLMLAGCGALVVTHGLIGLSYHLRLTGLAVVVPVMAAMACYALTLAPIVWVLIAEIFPNRIRGTAVSLAVCVLWLACFILTYTFPLLDARLGAAMTFGLYAAICAIGFCFCYIYVPETKGLKLEQIEAQFHRPRFPPGF